MDRLTKEQRANVMRSIKGKDTLIEIRFRKAAHARGIRYRKNSRKLFGKPDLSNQSKKFVVFLDSCFWHGCHKHFKMPSSNLDYWHLKISKNKKRDRAVNKYYRKLGWRILRVWEHDLSKKDSIDKSVFSLEKIIN